MDRFAIYRFFAALGSPRVDRYVHFSGPIFVCEID